MTIDDFAFHDSVILSVTEDTEKKTVDYLLDYAVDWQNNEFGKRILRFKEVITHSVLEMPLEGSPTILEVINHGLVDKKFGATENQMHVKRQKIEMRTNAGTRVIEFSDFDFLEN